MTDHSLFTGEAGGRLHTNTKHLKNKKHSSICNKLFSPRHINIFIFTLNNYPFINYLQFKITSF